MGKTCSLPDGSQYVTVKMSPATLAALDRRIRMVGGLARAEAVRAIVEHYVARDPLAKAIHLRRARRVKAR